MDNRVSFPKPSGIELVIISFIVAVFTSVFTLLFLYFKGIHKRKLWKAFFVTFTPLAMINYGYYAFFSNTTLHFLLYTSIPFVIFWILMFIFYKPQYYRDDWNNPEYWRHLGAFEFEEEITKLFQELGYKAKVTQKTVDFGVDVIVWIDEVKTAVQCKRYNGHPATCSEVRDLWGAKDFYNCTGAIMIALDGITRNAQVFIDKFENYDFMTIYDIIEKVKRIKERKENNGNDI